MQVIERDALLAAYKDIEVARMKLWGMIVNPVLTQGEVTINEALFEMVQTEVFPDYIKVTIKDILPREADIAKTMLRDHWMNLMYYALDEVNWQSDKVLCVIKVISPADYWDTDNRAYKFIIDSLRYKKIIPNDIHTNLSYMVVGGEIDRKNPRTEIYIVKHPTNPLFFLP